MIKNKFQVLFSIIFVLFSNCASNKYLDSRENELGTTGNNSWSFHRLSDVDQGTTLAFPGYIIAIEKTKRKLIGAPGKYSNRNNQGLKMFDFKPEVYKWKDLPWEKKFVLNDQRPTFVSSIFKFDINLNEVNPRVRPFKIYDAYDVAFLKDAKSAYSEGLNALGDFKESIASDILEKKITHVFVYSMGWNTDQQESIRNFNSLFLKTLTRAEVKGKYFKPLFIGLTWPSKWPVPIVSLVNKSNDADEIGMIWANLLINKSIASLKEKYNFKTIVLGHSLGAKLTSRAVMSASMLNKKHGPVDLLINLQSAYSVNRFSEKDHIETTTDYKYWEKYVNKIALIWSDKDYATKIGFWAPLAGAKWGYKKVKNNPIDFPDIEQVVYSDKGVSFNKEKQFYMIDASSIINKESYNKGGNAHSDIYNNNVADMLWELIESATF